MSKFPLLLAATISAGSLAGASVAYVPPVDGEVSKAFEAPAQRWSAGNRGLEYQTAPGSEVRAAAEGTVVFSGRVAGHSYVTVEHPDGVRTTYSYLQHVAVRKGNVVARGTILGSTTDRFQLGAKREGQYIDPALLLARQRVYLVPLDAATVTGQALH